MVNQNTSFGDGLVKLPKLGKVKFRGGDLPAGRLLSSRVYREADKWYMASIFECAVPQMNAAPVECVGIDMGLKTLEEYGYPIRPMGEEEIHVHEFLMEDPRGGDLEDALVDGIEEMFGLHQGGDAVIDIVVGQDRAEKLLLGLDVMGQKVPLGSRRKGRRQGAQRGDICHGRFP